ncbi:hypothetical protein Ciccas_009807, partial [Cichlidogyrus casuarinus]
IQDLDRTPRRNRFSYKEQGMLQTENVEEEEEEEREMWKSHLTRALQSFEERHNRLGLTSRKRFSLGQEFEHLRDEDRTPPPEPAPVARPFQRMSSKKPASDHFDNYSEEFQSIDPRERLESPLMSVVRKRFADQQPRSVVWVDQLNDSKNTESAFVNPSANSQQVATTSDESGIESFNGKASLVVDTLDAKLSEIPRRRRLLPKEPSLPS